MKEQNRVIFLGLDGAEPRLLERWIGEGRLPNLEGFLRDARHTEMRTCPGLGDGAVWSTLSTGMNPGRHGRLWYTQLEPGSYDFSRFDPVTGYHVRPFWEAMSERGRTVGVVDMVRCPLSRSLEGFQIFEWMTHDPIDVPRSVPESLIPELVERFGEDPNAAPDQYGRNLDIQLRRGVRTVPEIGDVLVDQVAYKTEVVTHLLRSRPCELFMVAFGEPHDIGHLAWYLHDPDHPEHDPAEARDAGNPILRVYRAVDRALGRIREAAGDDTPVVLFAGPGMEPGYTANHLLEDILLRLEFGAESDRRRPKLWRRRVRDATRWGPIGKIPPISRVRSLARRAARAVDRRRMDRFRGSRRFFAMPHAKNAGAIRLNEVGREPRGKVRPGRDFEATCRELEEKLSRIRNAETGRPIVQDVIRTSEIYRGPGAEVFPDLLVRWDREAPIRRVESPEIGELASDPHDLRTGDHSERALLAVRGPGIRPGSIDEEVEVEDVAPTLASLLSEDVKGLDGRALPLGRTATRAREGAGR